MVDQSGKEKMANGAGRFGCRVDINDGDPVLFLIDRTGAEHPMGLEESVRFVQMITEAQRQTLHILLVSIAGAKAKPKIITPGANVVPLTGRRR